MVRNKAMARINQEALVHKRWESNALMEADVLKLLVRKKVIAMMMEKMMDLTMFPGLQVAYRVAYI